MDKALISELQSFFDGRSKLNYAAMAIKCYTQKPSLFYACVDGFGNKKTINIPIEPTDLLPIIERYLDNIDKEIINISTIAAMPVDYNVFIEGYDSLKEHISDYEQRYPETFTSYDKIVKEISESYKARLHDKEHPGWEQEDYHIPVCSDWEDKIYVFNFHNIDEKTICVIFNGIYKL
ncbi:hypothetical protein E4T81_14745 [Barnesiella sp. WM24]|uniref:hypothetical protein n=1 Tax=Barnesiella sp. WM24 TaxID=2558278 RepID=UPI001072D045|nr:hypothetical protein [Barnesiella sp. WM24]TFU91755.1 hypothetical protein E4T81_14745 [Barnesiella sp. WM24]